MKETLLVLLLLSGVSCNKTTKVDNTKDNAKLYLSQQYDSPIDSIQQIVFDTITAKKEMEYFVNDVEDRMKVWQAKNMEFAQHANKYALLEDEVKKMQDSIDFYGKKSIAIAEQGDRIIKLYKTADSTNVLGYSGLYRVFAKTTSGTVIDTAVVIFNKDFSIRNYDNYLSELRLKYSGK